MIRQFSTVLAAMLALAAAPAARADAVAVAATLGRGINILGYDPYWKGGTPRFQPADFATIRAGGFATVRVNLFAFDHMAKDGTLDPAWLARLDAVVAGASAAGLNVILDEHDFDACSNDVAACRPRLLAFWRQVAHRYRAAPASVLFEVLNEPHGALTADAWNALLADVLGAVRREDPTRAVVIGPVGWNNFRDLPALRLPEADRNIVVTIHYYEPMRFTHQGAAWVGQKDLHGVTWGSQAERAVLERDFDTAAAWAKSARRPLLLGEFGAYEGGAVADRVAYDSAVARAAEARGWPWAYWQFDGDFVAFDIRHDHWIEPIHRALVPEDSR